LSYSISPFSFGYFVNMALLLAQVGLKLSIPLPQPLSRALGFQTKTLTSGSSPNFQPSLQCGFFGFWGFFVFFFFFVY
jgi:hypothetical protein